MNSLLRARAQDLFSSTSSLLRPPSTLILLYPHGSMRPQRAHIILLFSSKPSSRILRLKSQNARQCQGETSRISAPLSGRYHIETRRLSTFFLTIRADI